MVAEIDDLKRLLDTHARGIADSAGREYFQQQGDFDFHYRVIRGSGNSRLVEFLCGEIYHLLRMFRFRSSQAESRPQRALAEHGAILEAIERRDPELSEMLMRRHISNARRGIEEQLQHKGE